MPPHNSGRISAFTIDSLLFLLIVWGFYWFRSDALSRFLLSLLTLSAQKTQLLSWYAVSVVFIFAPAILSLFLYLRSATPGQAILRMRTTGAYNDSRLNLLQSFMRMFLTVLSVFPLNFIPQFLSLLREDRRSLIDLVTGTKVVSPTISERPVKASPVLGFVLFLLAIYPTGSLILMLVGATYLGNGVLLGGTAEERARWLMEKQGTPHEYRRNSPEDAFEALKMALRTKDEAALFEILSLPSQFIFRTLQLSGSWMEDMPTEIGFERKEMTSKSLCKIFFREIEEGGPSTRVFFMTFSKEEGEWKLDLLRFLQDPENPFVGRERKSE
ncbi:MAG: RDD family protein [Deltaproteobacteria bacterium]|nr:RDD family protein [Deltaproteobacteria bacterium]